MTPESTIADGNTILIIDDSPDNLRVLSKTLEAHGYAVRCVTNGAMAFASIQNSPPNLVLLDIRMPGMDGYEVCQTLKQDSNFRDIPVIFLSALDDVQDIVKAFQVGGVDYITKPFQSEEVLARIRSQLTIQNLSQRLYEQNQDLLQEIEERKKFEQALCQEIQRRTLIEASLQDAKNSAEAASYVKSEFLAQMSHELRTPLNSILGFSTLMKGDEALSQVHRTYMETIHDNARQLLKIINSVLAIAHAESSQLSLEEQELDLHHLLDSVVALWHSKALEKGLQFEFQRSSSVPQYIFSDEGKLRQIFMHLLDNSVQTTERGYVKVGIDVEYQSFSADVMSSNVGDSNAVCNLVIEVQDTGRGTALGELDTVFQLFSQDVSDPIITQELGLSLLLIRQFAQLMGGNVIFRSSLDQGSIVRVNLLVQLVTSSQPSTQLGAQPYTIHAVPEDSHLSLEALEIAMSKDWLIRLHRAAVKGFDQQILHLLQEIPTNHGTLARALEVWTRNFQFDRIVEITQSVIR